MPSYLYQCAEGHQTVITRPITSDEKIPACQCGLTMLRIWTAPPISFRGHGWGKDR